MVDAHTCCFLILLAWFIGVLTGLTPCWSLRRQLDELQAELRTLTELRNAHACFSLRKADEDDIEYSDE